MALLDTVNQIRSSREQFERRSQGQLNRGTRDESEGSISNRLRNRLLNEMDGLGLPAPKINMRRAMAALNQTFKENREAQLKNRDRQMRMVQAMAEPQAPEQQVVPEQAQQQAQAPQQAQASQQAQAQQQGMMPQAPQGMMGQSPSPFGGGLLG